MNENVSPGPGGWADVELALNPGFEATDPRVRAQIIGPLAVHRELRGTLYKVTHLRTGVGISFRFDRQREAVRFALRLLEACGGMDWDTDDTDELQRRILAEITREKLHVLAAKGEMEAGDE